MKLETFVGVGADDNKLIRFGKSLNQEQDGVLERCTRKEHLLADLKVEQHRMEEFLEIGDVFLVIASGKFAKQRLDKPVSTIAFLLTTYCASTKHFQNRVVHAKLGRFEH